MTSFGYSIWLLCLIRTDGKPQLARNRLVSATHWMASLRKFESNVNWTLIAHQPAVSHHLKAIRLKVIELSEFLTSCSQCLPIDANRMPKLSSKWFLMMLIDRKQSLIVALRSVLFISRVSLAYLTICSLARTRQVSGWFFTCTRFCVTHSSPHGSPRVSLCNNWKWIQNSRSVTSARFASLCRSIPGPSLRAERTG